MKKTLTLSRFPGAFLAVIFFTFAMVCFGSVSGFSQTLSVQVTTTNVTCAGAGNGGAVATPSGGTSPYTYLWSNGQTTPGISGLQPGIFTVTVTDNAGGTAIGIGTVQSPTALGVTFTSVTQICDIAPDGASTAQPFGGSPNYSYQWSNGATTAGITGLTGGIYTVTITDANGCSLVASDTVEFFNEGLWIMDSTLAACPNQNNGFSYIGPMSGTAPYTYQWSNGATTQFVDNLAPGTYNVTITDANGCQAQWPVTVGVTNLGATVSGTSQICDQLPDGTATVVPYGGNPPYTYLWSNGGTSAQITGLVQGTYSVTVTDANGCTTSGSADVFFWDEGLWLMDSTVNVSCPGANDGFAHVSVMSSVPPYFYIWSTGATGPDVFNLAPGNYSVTVSNAAGCTNFINITITEPTPIVLTTSSTNANCGLAGSATVTATGGTAPYTILWNTGSTNFTINATAGNYSATVTDANSCTATINVTISGTPNNLTINGFVTANAGCLVGGSAGVTVTGGSGNYAYVWDNGQMTATATNLSAGNHTVTVTDITTGCTGTATVNVPLSSPTINVTIDVTANATCLTGGAATAIVVGGATPLTFQWSNGQTTQSVTNLLAGQIGVTVTDATGCVGSDTALVSQQNGPTVTAQVTAQATCLTGGTATATATGGTTPYTYLWTGGQTTATATNLTPGVKTVTVTDAAGCASTASVTIVAPPTPMIVISASTNATCDQPGSATASVSGGTGPFTYVWSNGETTAGAINLAGGASYTVTVTDANGCTATATVSINQVANGITIGDYVWFDNDQDGWQHPLEVNGVPNITVQLVKPGPDGTFGNADDQVVGTTTTNSNGLYQFNCVTPGNYILMFSGLPAGFQWSGKDKVGNDCKDSDVNPNGKTDPFVISSGQGNNLCFDAGIHTICINVLNGGVICCNQTICEGETPALLYEVQPGAGGSGPFEYLWMQLVNVGPSGPAWVGIPGATSKEYQPGPLTQTAYFMRCVRRAGCTTFLESNIVTITVLPAGTPGCDNFINDFTVAPGGNNSVMINWITAPEAANYMYSVEYSMDQVQWTTIATTMGHRNTTAPNAYSAVHQTPASGMNYYRIKRTSVQYGTVYSDVLSVNFDITGMDALTITPTVVLDHFILKNIALLPGESRIDLVSTQGQVLETITIPAETFMNRYVNMAAYPAGVYFVHVRLGDGNTRILKIFKP